MAAGSNKFPAWFITCICVSICVSAASAQCVDGTYKHGELDCCLCAAGSHVTTHCTRSNSYGKCVECGAGTFKSHPDGQGSCDPCTSCSHPNENLEEAEPCTPGRDRKCRCIKDHYCPNDICRPCNPCTKCGEEGVKVPCTGKNDTVCNEKTEGGSSVGPIVGIIVTIVVLALVVAVVYIIWKRKEKNRALTLEQGNGNPAEVEIPLIEDLGPLLLDIAREIGWKDMERAAIRSNMPTTAIDACKLNHPGDAEEQTYHLLKNWVESQGKEASQNLVRILLRNSQKGKAERVRDILAGRSNV